MTEKRYREGRRDAEERDTQRRRPEKINPELKNTGYFYFIDLFLLHGSLFIMNS